MASILANSVGPRISTSVVAVISCACFLLGFATAVIYAPEYHTSKVIGELGSSSESPTEDLRRSFRRAPSEGQLGVGAADGKSEAAMPSVIADRHAELERQNELTVLAKATADRREGYTPVLQELGLHQDQIEKFLGRLEGMHRIAITAGDSMFELQEARLKHREEMRSILGEAGYSRYEAIEKAKPYRRELSLIKESAAEKWPTLKADVEATIVGLLEKNGMYTTESWDGPYDRLPRPQVGAEAMLPGFIEYSERIRSGLDPMLNELPPELPEGARSILRHYFEDELRRLEKNRERFSLPEEELKKLLTQEILERVKREDSGHSK
jgi:hypothetical protein